MTWFGDKVKRATHEGAVDALWRGTEHLLAKANETVPYNEGILLASGHADVDESDLVGVVSYDTPYAVRLHENPQYHFRNNRRGKWLQATMQEDQRDVAHIMEDAIRGRWPR